MDDFGALVLAGGSARRMEGQSKALLHWEGRTFLARLEEAFSGFEEKLLSTADPALAHGTSFLPLADLTPGRGPLEGLYTALTLCRSDALVVAACDMPLFPAPLAQALALALDGRDALICRDRAGGLHPLCGVYAKSCLPVLTRLLEAGERKVRLLPQQVNSGEFLLAHTPFPDEVLTNINTPEEFARLSRVRT